MMDPRRAHLNDPQRNATPPQAAPPPPPPPPPPPLAHDTDADITTEQEPTATTLSNGTDNNNNNNNNTSTSTADQEMSEKYLKFCTVCASNQNRSMEAHLRLSSASYPCISFGTGSLVRLPGPTITQPNVYPFNTTSYRSMYDELAAKDPRLYRANGLLTMLERNLGVKWGPERWQDWPVGKPRLDHLNKGDRGAKGTEAGVVDVVITCEERCWDAVVDDLNNRGGILNKPVHVINVDIRDNHEEALVGGRAILELADRLEDVAVQERRSSAANGTGGETGRGNFDERVPDVLAEWQEKWPNLPALWTLCWF